MTRLLRLALVVATLVVAGCMPQPSEQAGETDGLARAIQALGPGVDPREAARAADIAYTYALQLKEDYQVTDPPLAHNSRVMSGTRERGLCNDWAQDILARLQQEKFRTLDLHWVTSPPTNFRIIHHSAAISARGDSMQDAIILDGWRYGGDLFWAPVSQDTRYNWRPRMEVRAELLAKSQRTE